MTTHDLSAHADAICSRIFDVSVQEIRGRSRSASVCDARHAAWWILRERGTTLQSIGREYKVHHSTVLSAILRIDNVKATEPLMFHSLVVCQYQFGKATQ